MFGDRKWPWVALGIGALLLLWPQGGSRGGRGGKIRPRLVFDRGDQCRWNDGAWRDCTSMDFPMAPERGAIVDVIADNGQHGVVTDVLDRLRANGWSPSVVEGGT